MLPATVFNLSIVSFNLLASSKSSFITALSLAEYKALRVSIVFLSIDNSSSKLGTVRVYPGIAPCGRF